MSRQGEGQQDEEEGESRSAMSVDPAQRRAAMAKLTPKEVRLRRARPFDGDLRSLPYVPPVKKERPEREPPHRVPVPYGQPASTAKETSAAESSTPDSSADITRSAPAPAPTTTFNGLDYANWGAGRPPDTVGDVGPEYFIQSVNSSVGIYRKSDNVRVAAFTLDTFMSQGNFGNLCDTDNFGDPVVLYDTFEDRWIISDFAFQLDAQDNVSPQIALQCTAVSKTGDPVSGGWNFYSINTTGGLGDYPKFGVWTDGLYMSVNMFDYAASGGFQNPRLYAFNKAQMYAGAPTVQTVQFDLPATEFSLLPSNARLQTGTPPAGSPNYVTTIWNYLNVISVYKFKVDWNSISTSTLTGPSDILTPTWWAQYSGTSGTAPTPSNANDTLYPRLMMQNQYSNIGGVESLWNSQTAGAGNPTTNTTSAQAAVRYYQVNVTGGNVAANTVQNFTYSPDTTVHRYMPSIAVDRAGNMAIGYTTSNSTTHPGLKYAGRLSTDAVNTISQTEQTLFQGTGSQNTSNRWGDYSAMSLDPNGCTFWYTNEYYATTGGDWQTRIGSFQLPQCTPVGNGGAISGQVTANPGGAPIQGATVSLGSRTTTTDANGNYSFNGLPAGTYPGMTATSPGRNGASASSIAVTDGNITTRNFSLSESPASGCLMDTTQSDFRTGVPTTVDLNTSPGNVTLSNDPVIDQQNTTLGTQGAGFTNTTWLAQTFTQGVTGQLTRIDLNLFSLNCGTVTMPNLTVSVRATASNLPTGADLATATIPGFCNGGGGFFTATFATPITLTAGTQYAVVWRTSAAIPVASPAATYNGTVSAGTGGTSVTNPYAGGRRASSSTSGASWAGASGNANNDHGFKVYVKTGFAASGNLVSGAKDANPATGTMPTWGSLSWTATTPANTNVRFQAAASNNAASVFNFVGPDGTANTFFTNGASLTQFNGFRFLKYKALLTGTSTATPTLNDATICFANTTNINTTLTVDSATGIFGGTVNLSATLTDGANGISGKSIDFTLNGVSKGSASTNGSGVATLSNVSLAGINAGSYPTGVGASFAGGSGFTSSNSAAALTVSAADQTITVNTHAPSNAGYNTNFTVAATASSGLPVAYSSSGACTNSGATFTMTGSTGICTVIYDQAGNSNYNAAPQVTESVNSQKVAQTITFGALADKSYGDSDFAVSATASSGLDVSFAASGQCAVSGNNVHITGAGSCAITASQGGDSNYDAATDVSHTFSIAKANQTITFGALAGKTYGDPDFTVSATSSSGLNVDLAAAGDCALSGNTVHITGAGSCAITASQAGDDNYNAATDVSRSFDIAKAVATLSLGDLNQTYNGSPRSATVTTDPSGLSGVNITYDGSASAPTDAGSYAVIASLDNSNYQATNATGTLAIAKASANVTLGDLSPTYDGSPKSASASTTPSGLAVSITYDGSASAPTDAGSYAVVATVNNNNYEGGASGTLVIAKAAATINIVSASLSQTFNGLPKSVTATTNPSGLSGVSITYDGAATEPTDAGSYSIVASLNNPNYEATNATGTLEIAKATASISLSNLTYTYDGTAKSATATTDPAGLSGISVTYNGSATAPTGAGSYAVVATLTNNNYQADNVNDTLVVSPVALIITAGNKSREYAETNPAYVAVDVTYQGFVNNEDANVLGGTLSFIHAADAGSSVGDYDVTPSGLTSNNYQISFVAGKLTVTKAPLSVTPNEASRLYREANPTFTGTINGIKNSDNITANYNTVATTTSNVGTYPITATLNDPTNKQGNYDVTLNTGTLTINSPAPSLMTLNPVTVLGTKPSTGKVTLNGIAPPGGIIVTLLSDNPAASAPATVTVNAGALAATFPVSTIDVSTSTPVQISGSVGDVTRNATLTVNPIVVTGVSLVPASVLGGSPSTGKVAISAPAPVGGMVVTLSSNNGAATVSANVIVPQGLTSVTFPISTVPVSANTLVAISASRGGVTKSVTLAIKPPVMLSLSLNPTTVTGSSPSTGMVTLNGPAPQGGTTLSLQSNVAAATVAAHVTILAGQTTATFDIATKAVTLGTLATIKASGGGVTKSAVLTIKPPFVSGVSLNVTTATNTTAVVGTVTLTGPAPTGGKGVALTSSVPSAAGVPRSIVVPAGATTFTFPVTPQRVNSSIQVTITATTGTVSKTVMLTVEPPAQGAITPSPAEVNGQYVDALTKATGVSITPAEQEALVADLNSGALTRETISARIAERAAKSTVNVLEQYYRLLGVITG